MLGARAWRIAAVARLAAFAEQCRTQPRGCRPRRRAAGCRTGCARAQMQRGAVRSCISAVGRAEAAGHVPPKEQALFFCLCSPMPCRGGADAAHRASRRAPPAVPRRGGRTGGPAAASAAHDGRHGAPTVGRGCGAGQQQRADGGCGGHGAGDGRHFGGNARGKERRGARNAGRWLSQIAHLRLRGPDSLYRRFLVAASARRPLAICDGTREAPPDAMRLRGCAEPPQSRAQDLRARISSLCSEQYTKHNAAQKQGVWLPQAINEKDQPRSARRPTWPG